MKVRLKRESLQSRGKMEQEDSIEPTIYKFIDGDADELGGSQHDHQGKSIKCPHCNKEILLDISRPQALIAREAFMDMGYDMMKEGSGSGGGV